LSKKNAVPRGAPRGTALFTLNFIKRIQNTSKTVSICAVPRGAARCRGAVPRGAAPRFHRAHRAVPYGTALFFCFAVPRRAAPSSAARCGGRGGSHNPGSESLNVSENTFTG